MIILIHSSKTMRAEARNIFDLSIPVLFEEANELSSYLKTLSVPEIAQTMKISNELATKTKALIDNWTDNVAHQLPAVDTFIGDIYSGLQAQNWTTNERKFADQHLRILSGLYGILKPLDGIYPYRLEMGYRLTAEKYSNLYKFWGDKIAKTLPEDSVIMNLSAVEYTKAVLPFLKNSNIITPRFLTVSPRDGQPSFVTVHSKIARGAYANWLIKNQIIELDKLKSFKDLGYIYSQKLSTAKQPVFVCQKFGGLGLSQRLI